MYVQQKHSNLPLVLGQMKSSLVPTANPALPLDIANLSQMKYNSLKSVSKELTSKVIYRHNDVE